jgi:hypothetical protein
LFIDGHYQRFDFNASNEGFALRRNGALRRFFQSQQVYEFGATGLAPFFGGAVKIGERECALAWLVSEAQAEFVGYNEKRIVHSRQSLLGKYRKL